MRTLNRRTLLKAGTLAVLSTPYLARPAIAQTTITVASLLGEDKPETKIWRFLAEKAEERLPGRFRFNIVTNGALGGEKQVADGIRLGAVQASLSTVSALSAWVPELQLLDLPFLFRSPEHLRRVVTGPVGDNLRERLADERFIVGGFIDYGARHLLTRTPVTRPEQLEGVTIRVINSPLHTGLWSAFGAVPVGIPITETYNALSTGVADAMDLTKSAYAGFKLYEVVPCLTETGHIRASGVIYFSEGFWNGLDPETQGLLMEISAEAALYFNALIVEDETAAMQTARENGGEVFQPEDMDAWRAGARGVWAEFAPAVGGMERIEMIENG
ncbi:TRAP transporter substrate-binding protein [Martelella sp. AD-3]|uniref:TRAP transporter substrate-binding protein n=1 Tax=Martelella sp. AD-3 TaxID=686597 RepID=UPI000463CAAF|nr:TRAP transporter substrate-binding protein [Martelella sp. AD-3]AMM85789.1 ABC transporter substrate-binding protein [Martelella sp. AD-3]